MRLARADCDRELFAADAVATIHEAAIGGMRDIDRLATAALREAAQEAQAGRTRRRRQGHRRPGQRRRLIATAYQGPENGRLGCPMAITRLNVPFHPRRWPSSSPRGTPSTKLRGYSQRARVSR